MTIKQRILAEPNMKAVMPESAAPVTYNNAGAFRKFRVNAKTFAEVKRSAEIRKHSGPHTTVIDVSTEDRVAKAPGENKWNAMRALFAQDDDEIACAKVSISEWVCAAINVQI